MSTRSALLLGATGLIGGHVLRLLLADDAYSRVVTLGRRPLALTHAKLAQHTVNFDKLGESAALFQADDVFSCLGTTIKQAGSQEAFRRVDFTYVVESAKMARQQGASQFLLVSSLGADAHSSVFYNRVKGEIETTVSELAFDGVQIFRPSLLLGERATVRAGEKFAEKIAGLFSFAFVGPLKKYRPIEAHTVAAAMVGTAKQHPRGVNIYESDRIQTFAEN
jgi:uncharacterized protein YbjT (DUF2867 family)